MIGYAICKNGRGGNFEHYTHAGPAVICTAENILNYSLVN